MSGRGQRKAVLLDVDAASFQLRGRTFGPFTFAVDAGERLAVLGPSGAGKSTLLKLLARERLPSGGEVWLRQRRLNEWSLADLSRQRAVLPQSHEVAFGLPTDLVIGLGRVACVHDPDLAHTVRRAAQQACAGHLLGRAFDTLSGGEKARVQLARVFAQLWDVEQALLLVDEPLAALDPGLQLELMEAIHGFAAERGHAVLAVLHDINHALQGFERLLLVKEGALVGDLPSAGTVVAPLEALYGIALQRAVSDCGAVILTPARMPQSIRPVQVASCA